MTNTSKRPRGWVPHFWWRFSKDLNEVLIRTDDPRCPDVVYRVPYTGEDCLDDVDKVVADFQSGRRIWEKENKNGTPDHGEQK